MDEVRKFFLTLNLREAVSVGLLDSKHVFIKPANKVDFHRLWARSIWYVHGFPIRVFKWSTAFHVDKEPSVAPVWFQLPKLPVHYFHKEVLFQIVSSGDSIVCGCGNFECDMPKLCFCMCQS